jgi:hypothetical protein
MNMPLSIQGKSTLRTESLDLEQHLIINWTQAETADTLQLRQFFILVQTN